MEKSLKLKFVGIDNWNRPVFKEEGDNVSRFYGDTEHLFSLDAQQWEVLRYYKNKDLHEHFVYFGNYFGCEPSGEHVRDDVEITITGMDVIPERLRLYQLSWYSPSIASVKHSILANPNVARTRYLNMKYALGKGSWIALTIMEEDEKGEMKIGERIKYDEIESVS